MSSKGKKSKGSKVARKASKKAAPRKVPTGKRVAVRDPRIPKVGTVIVREYHAKTLRVTVTAEGFRSNGRDYSSLSAIAKEATGHETNGVAWFGLARKAEPKAPPVVATTKKAGRPSKVVPTQPKAPRTPTEQLKSLIEASSL